MVLLTRPGYLLTVSKHIQSAYLDFQLLCDGHKQGFHLVKVVVCRQYQQYDLNVRE
jgi:hypothetical protein